MQTISREELRRQLDGAAPPIVVDVLDPEDYRESHLPSAINVPWDEEFGRAIQDELSDKQANVVVYCRDRQCAASEQAARVMERLGYAHVAHFAGGKSEWSAAGLPLEHEAPASRLQDLR